MFPGGPPSLSGGGGAGSRGSSPAGRGGGGDSPGLPPPSPDTLRLPPEELPYVVGVSATHPHPCALCEKSFMKLSHLHHHQQVHDDAEPHSCPHCDRVFKHKRSRDRHVKLHTGDRKFRCPCCMAAFARSDHLKLHMRVHETGRCFRCGSCGASYATSAALASHLLLHKKLSDAAIRDLRCQQCGDKLSSTEELQVHLVEHEMNPDLVGSAEVVVRSVSPHPNSKSGREKPVLQCSYCTEICVGRDALDVHVETVHAGDKRNKCPICSAYFLTPDDFYCHIRTHTLTTDDSPLSALLGKVDSRTGALQNGGGGAGGARAASATAVMSAVAVGKKGFDCPLCSKKAFASAEVLEIHLRTMHADKNGQMIVCKMCNVVFGTLVELETHSCACAMPGEELSPGNSSGTTPKNGDGGGRSAEADPSLTSSAASRLGGGVRAAPASGSRSAATFPCDMCKMDFISLEKLQTHRVNSHQVLDSSSRSPDLLYCSQCTAGFSSPIVLSEHVHNVHGVGLIAPKSISPGGSSSSSQLRDKSCAPSEDGLPHVRAPKQLKLSPSEGDLSNDKILSSNSSGSLESLSNGEATLNCAQCTATFTDLTSYKNHVKCHIDTKGPGGGYTCTECTASFPTEETLENHIFVHFLALTTEYGCTSCLKLFGKPDELQKHLMDIHAHHLYRCSLCKEIFDSKVNIQVHFAIKHSNECKLYKCTTCASVFRSEMEWQLHVKVHHLGISKPYRCLFCKESFGTEMELQCHLTTHKKQFACPVCDEAFHVEYLLDKHVASAHAQDAGAGETRGGGGNQAAPVKTEDEADVLDYSMASSGAGSSVASGSGGAATPSRSVAAAAAALSPRDAASCSVSPASSSPAVSSSSNTPAKTQFISPRTGDGSPPLLRKGDLNYKCDICDVKFSEELALQKHRIHDHNISPEMTAMMQKAQAAAIAAAAATASKQQQQQQQSPTKAGGGGHGGSDKFSQLCVYCNQTFKTKSELEKHMKSHVTPSNQKCNICDEVFPSMTILAEHKLTHCKVVKGNMCTVCKVAMKNEEQFYTHAQQHGFQGTSMQCIVCRQTLASMLELQMHGKHHFQTPASFYTCCVCLGTFSTKENLVSKLNTSGRSYYVCKPCYHGELPSASQQSATVASLQSHDADCRCPACAVKSEGTPATSGLTGASSAVGATPAAVTPKKTFQCIKCQQSFGTEYEIQVHVASHVMQEGNVHECKICSSIFDSPAKLQAHLIEHTFEGQGEIRCYVCNMLFTHPQAIQMHVLEHGISARRYACTLCPQTFFFSAELQNHMYCTHVLTIAPTAQFASPPGGGIVFPPLGGSTSALVGGVAAVSPPSGRSSAHEFQCPECPKICSSIATLNAHRKAHDRKAAASPLKCTLCDNTYPSVAELQQHFFLQHSEQTGLEASMLYTPSMSGEKGKKLPIQHRCTDCGRDFPSIHSLQGHMKVHSLGKENRKVVKGALLKPFPCQLCSKTFSRRAHVKEHMKVHMLQQQSAQLQLHSCEICSEAFSAPKYLRRHLLMVHNQEPSNADAMDTSLTVDSSLATNAATLPSDVDMTDAASDDISFSSVDAALQNGHDLMSSDVENDITETSNLVSAAVEEQAVAKAASVRSNSPVSSSLSEKVESVPVVPSQPEPVTVN